MESEQTIKHIAFIMDGNGRWAIENNKTRLFGHQQGAKQIPKIIEACLKHEIQYMSFFAFSTENWNRPKNEIDGLLKLIKKNIDKNYIDWLKKRQIGLKIIGFKHPLLDEFLNKIKFLENQTKLNAKYFINIYINYGSCQEIVQACNHARTLNYDQTVESFNELLLTTNQPAVDLLIRSGKEQRLSNFLLWQCAYAEIIFEQTYWPAYGEEILNQNILEYNKRKRRYGGL